jgi:hypothetical protein
MGVGFFELIRKSKFNSRIVQLQGLEAHVISQTVRAFLAGPSYATRL